MAGRREDWLDRAGALVSFVCAVHCIALPIALAMPAFSAGFLADERLELSLVAAALGLAALSAAWGFSRHRNGWVVLGFAMAASLVVAGAATGEEQALGRAVAIAGGLALCAAHLVSARVGHRVDCADPH